MSQTLQELRDLDAFAYASYLGVRDRIRMLIGRFAATSATTTPPPTASMTMRISYKPLTGTEKWIVVSKEATVADVHTAIFKCDGTPVDRQRLIFAGKALESHSLYSYGIKGGSILRLVVGLHGSYSVKEAIKLR